MRLIAFIIFFLSILYLPYWFSIFLCVALSFIFTKYFEAIFLGFLADAVYSPAFGEHILLGAKYLIIFSATVVLVELLKTRLKFYNNRF